MFRLEKVFQNDDSGYILFVNFIKSLTLFFSAYLFEILSKNSIYDLINFELFKKSNYFFFSFFIVIIYFGFSFFLKNRTNYQKNFISFLKEDFANLIASYVVTLSFIFILNINFNLELHLFYILIFHIIILSISKLYFNFLYQNLIDKNIIQKNVMLVGTYEKNIK